MNPLTTRAHLFDDFFKDFRSGFFVRPLHGEPLPEPGQIRIDVKDSGAEYVVKADLPGVRKEDIHVHVEGSMVTLSAQVSQQDEQSEDEQVVHAERYMGMVSRSFSLPSEVDRDKTKARYENGVLMLTLPKANAARGVRIPVE